MAKDDKAYQAILRAWEEIQRCAAEKRACEIVVRFPLSPDGTIGQAMMSIERIKLWSATELRHVGR